MERMKSGERKSRLHRIASINVPYSISQCSQIICITTRDCFVVLLLDHSNNAIYRRFVLNISIVVIMIGHMDGSTYMERITPNIGSNQLVVSKTIEIHSTNTHEWHGIGVFLLQVSIDITFSNNEFRVFVFHLVYYSKQAIFANIGQTSTLCLLFASLCMANVDGYLIALCLLRDCHHGWTVHICKCARGQHRTAFFLLFGRNLKNHFVSISPL